MIFLHRFLNISHTLRTYVCFIWKLIWLLKVVGSRLKLIIKLNPMTCTSIRCLLKCLSQLSYSFHFTLPHSLLDYILLGFFVNYVISLYASNDSEQLFKNYTRFQLWWRCWCCWRTEISQVNFFLFVMVVAQWYSY